MQPRGAQSQKATQRYQKHMKLKRQSSPFCRRMLGMGLRMDPGVPVRMMLAFVAALLCLSPPAQGEKKNNDAEPKPDLRIPVEPLGYMAPSSFYLTARL
jgi:hypothetical protein